MGPAFEPMEEDTEKTIGSKQGEQRQGEDIQDLPGQETQDKMQSGDMDMGQIGNLHDARGEQAGY